MRLRRYLDDWLLQASSREQVLLALKTVLQLCSSLGIVVNWEKSQVIPTQRMVYLGVILDSISFRASPEESREASLNWRRILVLRKAASIILVGAIRSTVFDDPARSGRPTSHVVSSACSAEALGSCRPIDSGRVVSRGLPGSRLVARSRTVGARCFSGAGVPSARIVVRRLGRGLGAHLDEVVTSGLWAPEEVESSINVRELLAIERALLWFAPQLVGSSVAIFADNSTAIAYLRNQGGTHSPLLNSIAQRILRWAESLPVVISPQFIMGKHNVLTDALSRPNQIQGSEWTLKQEVFQDLCKRWPVSIDRFATSLNHQYPIGTLPEHLHSTITSYAKTT